MKLYIQGTSSYRSDSDNIDIKSALKKKYKLETRRQNEFIHLGVYGAKKLQESVEITADDELYITSGVGNIEVCQKATYAHNRDEFMAIYDFINMLGNTTSFYISKALNIKGKSIFQISDNFTFINSLISIYASLYSSKKDAILGSIDLVSNPELIIKKLLGMSEESKLISCINYQKLSLNPEKSIAELEFDSEVLTEEEIKTFLLKNRSITIFSKRCKNLDKSDEMFFCETMSSAIINKHIEDGIDLVYIDCFNNKYKILKLNLLTTTIS